ncbi:MAG: MotA/TolQ/ExbB proton channel family protein [Acidobacteria bacterium]|nr:MotA/TolQ/ExbB proton channel family protein [Acidobacteriota bacterium]
MIEFFRTGGVTMIFLGFASILALAVIIEKAFKLRKKIVIKPESVKTLDTLVEEKLWGKIEKYTAENPGAFTDIVHTVMENRDEDTEILKDSVEEAGRSASDTLERRLSILATVAGVAPLLGLFGTVLGMIKVFNVISIEGTGTQSLSKGIGEALITTATGLAIAIPALVAYNYFSNKVSEYIRFMEKYSLNLIKQIKRDKKK